MAADRYAGFAEFVVAHRAELSRLAYLLAGDHQAAADLVQSALARTLARWSAVSGYDRPDLYVRRAMYHESVSRWRRRRRIGEYPTAVLPDSAVGHEDADQAVLRVSFARALARLTRRQRAVLVLRFYEDRSPAAAAEVLGVSVGTVKSQTHHALARLRALAPELAEFVTGSEVPL